MQNNLQSHKNFNTFATTPLNRRRLLHLMGAGAAGLAGSGILSACWPLQTPSKTGGGVTTPVANATVAPSGGTITTGVGDKRSLTTYFLGYNNIPVHSPPWTNPQVLNAAKQLKPGTLRYPGGTVANYWDWKKGTQRPAGSVGGPEHAIYRLEELQLAVQSTGAQPIYVLNMLTSDLNTQLDMLRTAKGVGLPVQLVELGNEFYLPTPDDYVKKFPTGREYGAMATTWIRAIHTEFPDAKIAAVGTAPASQAGDARKGNWNQDMFQTLQGADAITIHPYVPLQDNLVVSGAPAADNVARLDGAVSAKWGQYENLIRPLPAGIKIWVTEYNLAGNTDNVFRTWIHGIIVAEMTLSYIAEPRTELVCFYDMIGQTGNEAIYYDHAGNLLAPYAPTAVGWVMRLLGQAMQGMNSAQQLTIGASAGPSTLNGWFFSNGSRRSAFVVNSSSQSFTWDIDATFSPGQSHYQQLSGDPFKIVSSTGSLKASSGTLQNQLVLPPYSVTELQIGAS